MTDPPPLVCAACGTVLTDRTRHWLMVTVEEPGYPLRGRIPERLAEAFYCQPCFDMRRANLLPLLERRYPKAEPKREE